MLKLVIFNLILVAIIIVSLVVSKKLIKTEKGKSITLIVASILTIVCHYSSIIYHLCTEGTSINFLSSNPNLVLPIYPCNVVMWCCLILGLIKKNTKVFNFLVDYCFLFGIVSALVGMFVNVDFVRNPTLLNYDVTKGIVAHAFMLFNVLLIPVLGYFKLDTVKNTVHIFASIIMMLIIGLYCNLLFWVVASKDTAYNVNSMFLIHSPFDGVEFLTYPLIALTNR